MTVRAARGATPPEEEEGWGGQGGLPQGRSTGPPELPPAGRTPRPHDSMGVRPPAGVPASTVEDAAHLTGSRVLELNLNLEPPQPTADDETVAEGMTPVRLVTAANRPRLPLAC